MTRPREGVLKPGGELWGETRICALGGICAVHCGTHYVSYSSLPAYQLQLNKIISFIPQFRQPHFKVLSSRMHHVDAVCRTAPMNNMPIIAESPVAGACQLFLESDR